MRKLKLSANFLGNDSKESFEPQRTYAGFIFIQGIYSEILALAVDNYTLPNYGVEILTLGWMSEEIKFPGKSTVDDLTWVLRDFVDVDVADSIDNWYKKTFNPITGKVEKMAIYKYNAYAILVGQDGSVDKNRWYRLEGAYPSRVERGDIDHTGSDYVKITVTLSIDRVVPLFMDEYSNTDEKYKQFAGSKNSFNLPIV